AMTRPFDAVSRRRMPAHGAIVHQTLVSVSTDTFVQWKVRGPGTMLSKDRARRRVRFHLLRRRDRAIALRRRGSAMNPTDRMPGLSGQTVVVIGGSRGIGLETARRARAEGANVILTARDADRLRHIGLELEARTTTFDAADFDVELARRDVEAHLLLPLQVARNARGKVRAGGTLLFMGGTGGRRTAPGFALIGALTAALPALVKNLALELAPVRVNLIAAGFVDTPLSARLLGDQLDVRREQLRATLPIRRVVGPDDIA